MALDLQACDNASGDIIQEILSSMPALTIFKAEKISDEDVLRDGKRPWVCLRLRVLSLGLVLKNQDGNDGVFLTQLARLEQLEELNLGMLYTMSRYRWIVDDDDEANMPRYFLRFALDRGLDQLKKLRQLRRLEGTDMDTFTWSRDEARWVLENWVNFKELSCVGIDAEAEKLLLERGVDLDC
ncbi:hypothetical protein BGZ83_007944 [Gryganskiella cystojenkinii]|nr:hypothetical protein BGZ83_007944 [Gryganskiella cystojenkinii]